MSEGSPRIAVAYIEVKARKSGDFDSDARRMGKEAGKEYEQAFEREAGKESSGAKAKRTQQGKKAGGEIGDAAGKEAGARTSKGISDGLVKAKAEREKDGDEFGRVLGTRAGGTAAKEISARFRHNRAGFVQDGRLAGEALGDGASASLKDRLLFSVGVTGSVLRARFKQVGLRAGLDTAAGISAALKSSGDLFRRDGAAVGTAIGAASGRRAAAATRASIKAEAAAEAKEAAAAAKAADQAEKAFGDRIKRIQKLASTGLKGVLVSGAVGGLASSISGLGTITAGTVGAVTALSGAVGLLPGVLVSAGVGALALKVGLHGVADALKNSGDATAYAKALKQLSPEAKAFTNALVKLKPQVKAIRESVQDGLFRGSGKEIAALGERYLPLVSKGLTETSQAFGRGRRAVAEYLKTTEATADVASILDDTSTSAGRLSRSFKPLVASFLTLAATGTGFLPDLTTGLANAAARLDAFTARTAKSGALKEFFQGGIDAVGDLGDALGGAARILGGIFKAGGSADTSVLETFAAVLNKVADQVARPDFQAGLSNFFGAIREAGDKVGDALPRVGDALVALEPAISRLVSGSGDALASILTTTADAAIALAPTINVLAGAFAALGPHAGTLVVALIALNGALKVLAVTSAIVDGLGLVGARMDKVGLSAQTAKIRTLGFSGALGVLGTAVAVVGVAALARQLGEFSGKANVATVDSNRLADSLAGLGRSGTLGSEGIALFTNNGIFGLVGNDADSSAEALDRFGLAAFNALDKGWDARLGRFQSFGQAEASFRKQTEQLDASFQQLAGRGAIDTASASFERFIAAGVRAGVPVASLRAQFPQFSASLRAAGLTVDNATGKVVVLSGALKGLPASKTVRVNAQGMTTATARAYALQSALRRLPTNKVVTVTTRFYQVGKEPGSFGNGLGVYRANGGPIPRLAVGGYLDPRLGAPRQDNVPVMASGGEFMVNAYATAAKGVLPLLRYINSANKLPQRLASGGQVAGRASAGMNDLSASKPARIARIETTRTTEVASPGSSRLHPDDIAALGAIFERAMRQQRVVLNTGEIAGAVIREAGRF